MQLYVCMYVRTHARKYVCVYVCTYYASMCIYTDRPTGRSGSCPNVDYAIALF
jgi:hypothetical protein